MKVHMELYGEKVKFDVPDVPLTKSRLKTAMDCMRNGHVREYWVQRYVKENAKKLKFSRLAQHRTGPDFTGFYRGKRVRIEVEVKKENFILHKHGPGWADMLIVLSPEGPEIKGMKTIYLDLKDFVRWWWPRSGGLEVLNSIELRLDQIASAFAYFFQEGCNDKERDMATCPNCNSCPYFGGWIEDDELSRVIDTPYDLPGAAREYFRANAVHYLKKNGLLEKVLSGEIPPEEVPIVRQALENRHRRYG
jgi:hypothetical protein